ncbi:ABC transporter permease [Symbiobacterium thermophilum]|uniref:Sugar ABC transporter permease n=1 Tax=Symbiobacterium thermophilum (strain DSM 24528 / JCM 14929 / IAM 14863 / T) TaxID=292459 RepID=Q67Q24_SYMTH|nr:ABC transporter permease [Symbiobacterium thermophilum]BAD40219.1 sugar ABC transporter permease [Symbiobacterium thermophilum IAM 14863]
MPDQSKWKAGLRAVGIPVLATIVGLFVGIVCIVLAGKDPVLAAKAFVRAVAGEPRMFGNVLVSTIPLIFTGLAVAFAYRAGLFNIGVEGQYLMAQIATVVVGVWWTPPKGLEWLHPILALGAGAVAGAIWGGIVGLLKAWKGVHEVINSIMMNWIALFTADWLLKYYLRPDNSRAASYDLQQTAWLKQGLIEGSRLHTGIWIALATALVVWIILYKTPLGYEIRAVGYSPGAAEYGGISVARALIITMAISGAIAGMAGSVQTMGLNHRFNETSALPGYGFDGIAVALVGRLHPAGVVLAALLFGALQASSGLMQAMAGVPKSVVSIVQAVVILFVAAEGVWNFLQKRKAKKGVKTA